LAIGGTGSRVGIKIARAKPDLAHFHFWGKLWLGEPGILEMARFFICAVKCIACLCDQSRAFSILEATAGKAASGRETGLLPRRG